MRLIVHAGFAKCGSSSIQHGLQNRESALKDRTIFLFGKSLIINDGPSPSAFPFWTVVETLQDQSSGNDIAGQVLREIERVSAKAPDGTVILSAESLGRAGAVRMLNRIDEAIDTTVVFYIRPQFEWIPSAWKQWSLKQGQSIASFVDACIGNDNPRFLAAIEAWSRGLPKARLIVRILPQVAEEIGGPAKDFFSILGVNDLDGLDDLHHNPSLDYSILHVLNKNPWLFKDGRANRVFQSLSNIIAKEYLRPNIRMLSSEQEARIADHFHDQNMRILKTYAALRDEEVGRVYNRYFRPNSSGPAYADASEIEILQRAFGILIESMIRDYRQQEGRRQLLRPPYWKVPWRAAKRIIGRA